MEKFIPDFNNIVNAAKNKMSKRIPLYEHGIAENVIEDILNTKFSEMKYGDILDKKEYMRKIISFYSKMGYDTVSFERGHCGVGPGGGSLGNHKPPTIKNRLDFENYPWDDISKIYFEKYSQDFKILISELPNGMKAIGGVGNGIFEGVQDLVGYETLSYMKADDEELYHDIFTKMSEVLYNIWEIFLSEYSDGFCLCRIGDDLGFKSSTLISPTDIKDNIIPGYKEIVKLVHSYNKPFLLHSCGNIFDVMDDFILDVKIDAKHSNEDAIAPFSKWVEKYGDRIGNFGGIDTDIICGHLSEAEVKEYVTGIVKPCIGKRGIAIGSGNSIPSYTNTSLYLAYIETVRKLRGE